MFSAQTYVQRRDKLKAQVGSGLILIMGNNLVGRNYLHNAYRFRQDSNFLYFFGLQKAGLAGIIDIDNNKEILFGDDYTIDQIVWVGSQPKLTDWAAQGGITDVRPFKEMEAYLKNAQSSGQKVHFTPPYRDDNKIYMHEVLGVHPYKSTEEASLPLIKAIVAQRNIKSDQEVEELDKAVKVTCQMHLAAMRSARPGMKESEIMAIMTETCLKNPGYDLSFPSIVTVRGEILHNETQLNTMQSGQLLLIDGGAETPMNYAGDMSRTFPVDTTFTERQKAVYEVALASHEAAIAGMKPGVPFRDLYYAAAREIFEGLKGLGITKGDTEEALNNGAYTQFFQCGLGHMMGMDIHDMEDLGEPNVGYDDEIKKGTTFGLKSLRLGKRLEAGNVVTIEPGIYFIPELMDMWRAEKKHMDFINYDELEKYKDFGGIRNEEDFLITPTGYKLLGDPIAKTIPDIEEERKRQLEEVAM